MREGTGPVSFSTSTLEQKHFGRLNQTASFILGHGELGEPAFDSYEFMDMFFSDIRNQEEQFLPSASSSRDDDHACLGPPEYGPSHNRILIMSIGKQVSEAIDKMQAGDTEGALHAMLDPVLPREVPLAVLSRSSVR
jgi:hypothetical protein